MPAARRLTALTAGAALILLAFLPAIGGARTPGRERTEAQLKTVRAAIAQAHAKASQDQAERQRLTRELRTAELSESTARTALDQLQKELARRGAERTELAARKRQRQAQIAAERTELAGELRAAYLIGRDEPLKLLLNQQDPARAGRMLAYYGYFGRARAKELSRVAAGVKQLDALDAQLADEEQSLSALESQQSGELAQLDGARLQRTAALTSLDAQSRTQAERLRRLQRERAGFERLLRRLRRTRARPPAAGRFEGHGAFARLRGTLAWPVAGRIAASYGQPRAGGLRWEGELIDTRRGAPVRAVSSGRVIFADWLPGLGLLIIIDHGGGYLSLYGHDQRLYKKVGDEVSAGDIIAAAGDSGGSSRPELYFGIRSGDQPVDPRSWFRTAAPVP
ncbi:MAG: murein hydrolase activator EnvC family protein [Steroidobacteraceae bacterium]